MLKFKEVLNEYKKIQFEVFIMNLQNDVSENTDLFKKINK